MVEDAEDIPGGPSLGWGGVPESLWRRRRYLAAPRQGLWSGYRSGLQQVMEGRRHKARHSHGRRAGLTGGDSERDSRGLVSPFLRAGLFGAARNARAQPRQVLRGHHCLESASINTGFVESGFTLLDRATRALCGAGMGSCTGEAHASMLGAFQTAVWAARGRKGGCEEATQGHKLLVQRHGLGPGRRARKGGGVRNHELSQAS